MSRWYLSLHEHFRPQGDGWLGLAYREHGAFSMQSFRSRLAVSPPDLARKPARHSVG